MPYQPPARQFSVILPALLSLMPIWALGGCSDGGAAYPSLASRPVERITDPAPVAAQMPDPATASVALSPELAARLDKLVGQARDAKKDFDDQQAPAERLIAAAGNAVAGSEPWARATQAMSGVQSARSRTAQPLSDLDQMDVDDRLHGAQIGADTKATLRPETAAIAQARRTVSAMVAAEDDVLGALDGRLAR
jgi:hypothetical protein